VHRRSRGGVAVCLTRTFESVFAGISMYREIGSASDGPAHPDRLAQVKRAVLTVLSLISFLVCIGASIFWWRGCRGGVDTLIYSKSHENKLLIQSVGGRLECWTLNNEGMI
jgi:hypothetical protein